MRREAPGQARGGLIVVGSRRWAAMATRSVKHSSCEHRACHAPAAVAASRPGIGAGPAATRGMPLRRWQWPRFMAAQPVEHLINALGAAKAAARWGGPPLTRRAAPLFRARQDASVSNRTLPRGGAAQSDPAQASRQPQLSATPLRPARSVKNCQATRPDRPPRVACHSTASARSSALSISRP